MTYNNNDIDWDNYEWDEELGEMVSQKKNSSQDQEEKVEDNTVFDSDGKPLTTGDNVKTIKDLNVKGMSKVIKRGETIKKIKIINESVECKFGSKIVVLKPNFLKKC